MQRLFFIFLSWFFFAPPCWAKSQDYDIANVQAEARLQLMQSQGEVKQFLNDSVGASEKSEIPKELKLKRGAACRKNNCGKKEKKNFTGAEFGQSDPSHQLIVFVSFSVPQESLKAYAKALERVGGRLVMQGLVDDSFKITQERLLKLGVELDIDPPLFEKHRIQRVPTFVWLENGQEVDRLQGHVSVLHVLEEFSVAGNLEAKTALGRLQEEPT